ncbi:MAG: M15 family metallopeptidase [Arcicella sp.]|nr:M15 family metallopeptidase [Arcicella sp.]
MFLTTLLLRHFFKITLACITLWACNFIDKTNKLFNKDEISWQNLDCDTTQTINNLSVYDIAQPFYNSDTLLHQKLIVKKVFVAIVDLEDSIKIGGVVAQNDERPQIIGGSSIQFTWQEQEYLWALAAQPRYLYHRWEKLLMDERINFLTKRDSIHAVMKNLSGSVKIISDLRSMANQQRYLQKNKTASPISMHNFGFAADFAIMRNNRISNNLSLYKPLDELTAQQGMTWGGNFVGFLDPGHIQLFKNGAEMLRKYPDLIFEFEPYRPQYNNWMNKMIGWGKEAKAGDTRELLVELNKYKKDKPCPCLKGEINNSDLKLKDIQEKIQTLGYQQSTDLLLVGNIKNYTLSLTSINGTINYGVGMWK